MAQNFARCFDVSLVDLVIVQFKLCCRLSYAITSYCLMLMYQSTASPHFFSDELSESGWANIPVASFLGEWCGPDQWWGTKQTQKNAFSSPSIRRALHPGVSSGPLGDAIEDVHRSHTRRNREADTVWVFLQKTKIPLPRVLTAENSAHPGQHMVKSCRRQRTYCTT